MEAKRLNNVGVEYDLQDLKGKYHNIVQRCTNHNREDYERYGERGIKVADYWMDDMYFFIEYVINLEGFGDEGKTLDRIDNDKGYEKGNLKWSTPSEQVVNRRKLKSNSSGYIGVSINKGRGADWQAYINWNHKRFWLGYFDTVEDGVRFRNNFIRENDLPHKIQNIK